MTERRTLYPPIEPFDSGMLDVGDGHSSIGSGAGRAAPSRRCSSTAGPAAGRAPTIAASSTRRKYDVLLFDQRGCGRSTPHASLDANTTWDLVADIERLREMAGDEQWLVFGGSWGSTLSLAYAQTHPERVTELVLRGIFLFDQYEIDWLYKQGGASQLYPDKWEEFVAPIPTDERGDLVEAYRRRLTGDDRDVALAAAQAWSTWEGEVVTLLPSPKTIERFTEPDIAIAIARIENHYMANHGWLEEGQLLARRGEAARHSRASSSRAATIAAPRRAPPGR